MPQTRVRVVGSGFTTLQYNGQNIAFLDSFNDSGQSAAQGAGTEAIIPLGSRYPVEIVTSRVLGPGTITASITELWNQPVWYQLSGLAGRRTLVDVWEALAESNATVTCRMVIRPPQGAPRGKVYHGCVVTAIPDNEQVTIGALSISRAVQIAYTHSTAA
jgi:hypothetical protein